MALLYIYQPKLVASDMSATDWWYQTQVKKYKIFLCVLLWFFSGLEILVKHRRLYDKIK